MSRFFTHSIILWSKTKVRALPWQQTEDAYYIWLREIILQQTRVEQGYKYYQKFVSKYPTVFHLADAGINEVYKDWEGLGYYNRAKNLHEAAKYIVKHHDGKFPAKYEEVLALKGVGEYTASAILSFAYHQPYAVLDGNVFRVLSRFFGIKLSIDTTEGKKYFKDLAQKLLDKNQPAVYNQAIMDLGAVICKPAHPDCENCPLAEKCKAFNTQTIPDYPVKKTKKPNKKSQIFFNFLVIESDEDILIQKREEKDIWKYLYQFPVVESEKELLQIINKDLVNSHQVINSRISKKYKQKLTHRNIEAKFFEYQVKEIIVSCHFLKIKKVDLNKYSFPKIIRDYLSDKYKYLF
ncbi:MAG: A/G-specific adenine glycosylase [Chitinophagales bacterium]|nr:A/G-specific adenine glycosylase [Chitinophagales bacterium]